MPYVAGLDLLMQKFGADPIKPEELALVTESSAVVIDKYGGIPFLEELLLAGALVSVFGPRLVVCYFTVKRAREGGKPQVETKKPAA